MIVNIHGKQYNLEKFNHPGGREILELCNNEPDCTALFESYHAFCDMNKISGLMKKYEIESDKNIKTMFNFEYNGFYNTCKREVLKRFAYDRITSKSDRKWLITVISSLFLFFYFQWLYLFYFTNPVFKLFSSFFSGITIISLGYNILHDGSHYAISERPFINQISSRIIQSLLLLNHKLWSYHHCIRHHQYTGNYKLDPDMFNSQPFIRKSNKIKPRSIEFSKSNISLKFILFNIFFPGTMVGQSALYHLKWVRTKRLWKMDLPKMYFDKWTIFQYLISICFCIIEIYYGKGYFLMHIIGTNFGYFIGSAPDHDMYFTHLQISNYDGKMDWGEMQVRHSANFMNNYSLFTKFYGGINYQIEHHLFPTLCNSKLKIISPTVIECCKKFNIPYHSVDKPIEIFKEIVKTYQNVLN